MKNRIPTAGAWPGVAAVKLVMMLFFFIPRTDAQVVITTAGTTYTQDFNSLASSGSGIAWADNSTITGWYVDETTYNTSSGATTAGALYSFGNGSNSERALGSLASAATSTVYFGVRIKNNACNPITSVNISYTGEQWRCANTNTQTLDFQYQLDATAITGGTWTDFSALSFTCQQTCTSGALDGNNVSNRVAISGTMNVTINPGQELWLRWKDSDDSGSDHALGIDDLSIAFNGSTDCFVRSLASGNWNNLSSWERSADSATWSPATAIPDFLSGKIFIRNGNSITITSSISIDQLTVDTGATLIYGDNAGSFITFQNGSGTDLTLNGAFEDNGPNAITWNNSATWTMGSNATLIRTRSTSSDNWRDSYEGGISNITATANWILRKVSSDNPSLTTIGGMHYPNLTIENNTASAWITTAGTSFTGSSSFPTIKGNFSIGGNGTSTVNFLNDCRNVSPVMILGDLTVKPGSTFRNYGTGIELRGNLQCDGTITYDSDHSRMLFLSGNTNQSVSGNGSIGILQMKINKPSGSLTLNKSITADSLVSFVKGNIMTATSNLLIIANNAIVSGASDSSYADGPVRKNGSTDFTFPVGKDGKYRPISIGSLSSTDTFTAEYFHNDPNTIPSNTTLLDTGIDHVSSCEYWELERTGTVTAQVNLSWNSFSCGVTSLSELLVSKWNATQWSNLGNGGTSGNTTEGSIFNAGTVNSFGFFTLGSSTGNGTNPLPITLLNFSASYNGRSVKIEWETGDEINTDYFLLEKTDDFENFESVTMVKAAGNSSTPLHYQTEDPYPFRGDSWYRLRTIDLDGRSQRSENIHIHIPENEGTYIVRNPSSGKEIILHSPFFTEGACTISIIETDGRICQAETIPSQQEMTHIVKLNASLTSGMYFLKLTSGYKQLFFQLVIA